LNLNCSRVIPFGFLYWKYPSIFLPHYAVDLPHKVFENTSEIKSVLSLWEDSASRQEYLAQMKWRILMDFYGLPSPVSHETYFPLDLIEITDDEIFVDCGAYDGDTIRKLIESKNGKIGGIVAFEPDPSNYSKLKQSVEQLPNGIKNKIILLQKATGAHKGKVLFNAAGNEASSVVLNGNCEVDCVALDEELNQTEFSFLKMDIEGSEVETLLGAKEVIKKNLPVLAVCAYHQQSHVWEIPSLINSISDQYRFFLRPHLLEVWDLVCYAIPVHRLKKMSSLNA